MRTFGFAMFLLAAFWGLSFAQGTGPEEESGARRSQPGSRPDQEIVQRIRKSLILDQNLSMEAKTVQVIVRDGFVTLRGSVQTQVERDAVAAKARKAAGMDHVDDRLVVGAEEGAAVGPGDL